jgi:hypothetical protein
MLAYKLVRVRKDGSLGSLFIDRRTALPIGEWLEAQSIPTKGFAVRYGWHALAKPMAPHLSKRGRAWFRVRLSGVTKVQRPQSQGGLWYIAKQMKILRKI